jgi:ABC-type glycerol-3-phosphate transport system substrate-binding protein
LCESCATHFAGVREHLTAFEIPSTISHRLVRGLDYYTRTTFEVLGASLGAQNALLGGGRYDGLVKTLGGPDRTGIGFAAGLERLVLALPETAAAARRQGAFVVAIVGNAAEHYVAVVVARKDKMDLSVNIAIGSSAQIALFVAPVLVLLSFVVGANPMALVFNGYELAGLMASEKVEERNLVKRLGVVWPNQNGRGTHINVSGGGMIKTAKHREAAVRFLEYLASDEAQRYFASGNNEWPAVPSVSISNEELDELGKFKADNISLVKIANQLSTAQKLLDRAGYR